MIPRAAIELIKRNESLRLKAYLCPAGVPTIGWGHTATVTQEDVRLGRRISRTEAERLLQCDIEATEAGVLAACTVPPNPNQLGAMVSLAFNIGLGWDGTRKPAGARDGFRQSTVRRAHNRGDFASAARAFALWNKATVGGAKVVLNGLVTRRAQEAALYLSPTAEDLPETIRMPQAVEPEPSLRQSTIIQGGAATAAASGLGMAADAARSVADIRYSLGDWLPIVFGVLVIASAGYIIYQRFKQRREGRA